MFIININSLSEKVILKHYQLLQFQIMDEFDEIFKLYPDMILIKKEPPTWKGVLTVNNAFTNCEMKVKVKLAVPSFPLLDNAVLHFGASLAFLFSKKFKNQIESILLSSESVVDCFRDLNITIVS